MTAVEKIAKTAYQKGLEDGAFFAAAEIWRRYETSNWTYAMQFLQRIYSDEGELRAFVAEKRA